MLKVGQRDAASFVEDTQVDGIEAAPILDADRRLRRGVFRGIVEEIEQRLFEQHGIEFEHRQIRSELEFDIVSREDPARAAQRTADDLADVIESDGGRHRPGFELGHVEQVGDEAVESLELVDDRGQQVRLFGVAELLPEIAQRSGRSQHRGERRLQVMGDRGKQRRAQPLSLGSAFDAIHLLDQLDPLDGERALVAQRVEQAPLIGRE